MRQLLPEIPGKVCWSKDLLYRNFQRKRSEQFLGYRKKYRSLTFQDGWQVEFSCEGYEFINEADTAGREILLSVESFIAGVLDYETGMF